MLSAATIKQFANPDGLVLRVVASYESVVIDLHYLQRARRIVA
jgi:hypothetical protein